ncbi:CRISPR-associated helicase Cas3' [Pusillimonas sp. TS35]|nr:CRISPR-associated helicase Cas3' [Pusillimonas sp. TS35]
MREIVDDRIPYWRYWGKAQPGVHGAERYHLLPYHSLDVAACGHSLLRLPALGVAQLAGALGWPLHVVESLAVFFFALHDLGKFASSFQKLALGLSPDLIDASAAHPYTIRHDTLGWAIWVDHLQEAFPSDRLPAPEKEFWCVWMRAVVGHHGVPPMSASAGGLLELRTKPHFSEADLQAVDAYVAAVAPLLLPADIPVPTRQQTAILRAHSWRLAGAAVLADWLGSDRAHFMYRSAPGDLSAYWGCTALPCAGRAVAQARLEAGHVNADLAPMALFDYLREPTPLQRYAADVALDIEPQLFILEDVTGAGKTEAAMMLVLRMMQAGLADGVYLGLPSMATANQMYRRMGGVYRQLFDGRSTPSLMLAHGARELVDDFRQSVLRSTVQPSDPKYGDLEATASLQCNAWLTDNRKKSLLADVGVGTLDQALLAVLPVRHQSLRLLGLAGKVLVVDEVHSYDTYMLGLLKKLLYAHAMQGGSAVLLSATLSLVRRDELLNAFREGQGKLGESLAGDARYPLAIHAGAGVSVAACDTRPLLRRTVSVDLLYDEDAVIRQILRAVEQGQCVAWIRNTVSDVLRACASLGEYMPSEYVHVFHSRYAMGHRLDIEDGVLARFGKTSGQDARRAQVLIGSQVLEQSLDFDVDVMVSDLAPVDLLIQRAGRLQRHARDALGNPSTDGRERRASPVLFVLSPAPVDEPSADWYAGLFPKACYVYPDAVALWRTARALSRSGCIVTPGEAEPGAVRSLVEAVYGREAEPVPERLRKASNEQAGKDLAIKSLTEFNALDVSRGYCMDSNTMHWYEESDTPTRLGDETLTLYLARVKDNGLQPLVPSTDFPWEHSSVRVRRTLAAGLAPTWQNRYGPAIQHLRDRFPLLAEPAFIVPLEDKGEHLIAELEDERRQVLILQYDQRLGLCW